MVRIFDFNSSSGVTSAGMRRSRLFGEQARGQPGLTQVMIRVALVVIYSAYM